VTSVAGLSPAGDASARGGQRDVSSTPRAGAIAPARGIVRKGQQVGSPVWAGTLTAVQAAFTLDIPWVHAK